MESYEQTICFDEQPQQIIFVYVELIVQVFKHSSCVV